MPIQRLIVVQPCYSLEDLTRNLDADNASDYHACWTALWHPHFLMAVPNLPECKRSDTSSLDVRESLILIPAASKDQIDTTLRERLDLNENVLMRGLPSREENVAQIAYQLGITLATFDPDLQEQVASSTPDPVTNESKRTPVCVRSFYSLGFAYQQLQILTRKVHYSTNLDLMLLHEQVTKAATAFCNGQKNEAERWLQSCFDQLSQERDRYFSQQANLIDLTLLASSTLGDALSKQLHSSHAQNILASAQLLEQMDARNKPLLQQLAQRSGTDNLSLVGGMHREAATPWLSGGYLLRNLAAGRKSYERLGVKAPKIFSRLSGGTQSQDAQALRLAGYTGAILSAWLDGELPRSDQAKIRWQSADSKTLDAIAGFVLDAESSLSVLSLAVEFAKQFDYHQVPTLIFAHWPNRYCEAFRDLLLITERSTALGIWCVAEEYFEGTAQAYSNTSLPISQFKFPLPSDRNSLQQFCTTWLQINRVQTLAESLLSNSLMVQHLTKWMSRNALQDRIGSQVASANAFLADADAYAVQAADRYRSEVSIQALGSSTGPNDASTLTSQSAELLQAMAANLSSLVSGKNPTASKLSSLGSTTVDRCSLSSVVLPSTAHTYHLINPLSVPMRYFLRTGSKSLICKDSSRVYAHETSTSARKLMDSGLIGKYGAHDSGGHEVIVDVSAHGITQLETNSSAGFGSGTKSNIAISNLGLVNEYLDVQLDANTGYLRSLLVTRKRGSRMSGQLSILAPGKLTGTPDDPANPNYAQAQNVKLTIEHNSNLSAIIAARGRLVFNTQELAQFEILYELWRGSRLLQITPTLTWSVSLPEELGLWEAAPVWRTAWPSPAATLRTWQHNAPTKISTATIFSPQVLEIDDAEHRLYLMTAGVCSHRRKESSYLDTHLGDGKSASFLVGLDVPHPLQQWQHWTQTPWLVSSESPMASNQSSASFLSSSHNGLSMQWVEPDTFFAAETATQSGGRRFDAYFLVQETLGKSTTARIQFYRDVKKAAKVNSLGLTDELQSVDGGDVLLKLQTCESAWLGVDWAE